jgi:MoaA/NifB/PqqE/SkfB family radical SAM enzyme
MIGYEFGQKLAEAGINTLTISLNATSAEQYERINNSKGYDRAVKNAEDCLKAINDSGREIIVFLRVLTGKINSKEQVKAFRDFWAPRLGTCGVIAEAEFVNWAGSIDATAIEEKEREARGEVSDASRNSIEPAAKPSKKSHKARRYPCYSLFVPHYLSREGNAISCCMVSPAEQGDLYLGNIADEAIWDLYESDRAKELWRKNLNCEIYKMNPCDKCNSWQAYPNIWQRNPFYPLFGTKWV